MSAVDKAGPKRSYVEALWNKTIPELCQELAALADRGSLQVASITRKEGREHISGQGPGGSRATGKVRLTIELDYEEKSNGLV